MRPALRVASSSAAQTAAAVPRGTRLGAADPSHLSVLSYNLLAPLYVRPVDQRTGAVQAFAAFEWAQEEDLHWPTRRERLRAEIEGAGADVVCLQEVQFERPSPQVADFRLPEWLQVPGYSIRIPGQKELQQIASRNLRVLQHEAAIGNALLFRSDRLTAVDESEMSKKARDQETTRVGACLRGLEGSGLAPLGPTAVFSVHLDATSEAQRVSTLRRCLEGARAMGTRSVLIAGDLNSELKPGSCTAALVDGPAASPMQDQLDAECLSALRMTPAEAGGVLPDEQRKEWADLWASAAATTAEVRMPLARAPTAGTRSGYAFGCTEGPCEPCALDHVLYTPHALQLAAYWQTLEADLRSAEAGLPNPSCPSDHLPVAATFELLPLPEVSGEERNALLGRVSGVAERQTAELSALLAAQQAESQALEAEEGPSEESAAEAKPKQKRAKKGPPSPAVIELKRRHRAQTKQIKAEQLAERLALCGSLNDTELDALERVVDLVEWRAAGGAVPKE